MLPFPNFEMMHFLPPPFWHKSVCVVFISEDLERIVAFEENLFVVKVPDVFAQRNVLYALFYMHKHKHEYTRYYKYTVCVCVFKSCLSNDSPYCASNLPSAGGHRYYGLYKQQGQCVCVCLCEISLLEKSSSVSADQRTNNQPDVLKTHTRDSSRSSKAEWCFMTSPGLITAANLKKKIKNRKWNKTYTRLWFICETKELRQHLSNVC